MRFLSIVSIIVFVYASVTSQQTCDVPPQDIRSMKPSFGGISGFYSISKGISDGLQSTPNSKTYNDLNSLIFGNGAVTYNEVIKDMVVNQIGAIVFWSFGFVLILAALVLGIATSIWACCYTCVPKEGSIRSKITGYVYAGLLVAIFAFVLTGVILFNIAETNLVDSIDNGVVYTRQIAYDLNTTITNGTGQLTCEVGKTTTETFQNVNLLLQNYSTVVVDGTSQDVGIQAVNNFDDTAFDTQNQATISSLNALTASFGTLNSADPTCTTNKLTLSNSVVNVTLLLRGFTAAALLVRTNPALLQINSGIAEINQQIQTETTAASSSMNNSQSTINNAMSSITDMLSNVQSDLGNVMNSIERGQTDVTSSGSYTLLQVLLRLGVTIPACVGCIFMIVALVAIAMSLRQLEVSENVNKKMSTAVMVLFYISIVFSIILLALSSVTFVAGWFMSAMCVPIFEDPSYQLFHLMNQTIAPVNNGSPTVVNIGDMIQSCSDPSTTIYTAINGSNIISANSILSQLNLTSYRDTTNQQINNQPVYQYPMPTAEQQSLNQLNDYQTAAQGASLTSCGDNAVNSQYDTYISNLKQSTAMATVFYNNLVKLSQNAPNVNTFAIQHNNAYFVQGDANINQSVSNLMTNLTTTIFKCNPFVKIYHNGGFVMCEQFGKPIQGLWAAIGLSGLFMFFLAILLLLIYRWLKKEDVDGKQPLLHFNKSNESDNHSHSPRKVDSRSPLNEQPPQHDVFYKPVINSTSNTGRLPRIRPMEYDDQLSSAPYLSNSMSSRQALPRVQVLPDVRHPPMNPNYYDTQQSGSRLARFDDIDLFGGDQQSNNGSTARGLRRF